MRDHLQLFLNGQPLRVDAADAFVTLSDFLRKRLRLTGTKVVCAEGDCGSCSVLLGRLDSTGESIRYSAVTSCIGLMCQLDATHVVTVEGLRGSDKSLTPVQQAMVQCQGTQCGFCTPGFVVALHDHFENVERPDAESVRRGLVGNLCRCTGYDSIVRAALTVDRSTLTRIDDLYPQASIAPELKRLAADDVELAAPGVRVHKPATLAGAVAQRAADPEARIFSGTTDLGVGVNKRAFVVSAALVLNGVNELRSIEVKDGAIVVGGAATLTDVERFTLRELRELGRYLGWFGSPPIKNAGTLAGNLATASPISDTAPPLIAMGAEVVLASPRGTRRLPVEQFLVGYRKTDLAPDELIAQIVIPIPKPDETVKLYKVSRRKDLDIATFGAAFWVKRKGDVIEDVRIAYGAVGPKVMRMRKTENALRGKPATAKLFEQAGEVARTEATPISDVRGSEQYRRLLARNALPRLWQDVFVQK